MRFVFFDWSNRISYPVDSPNGYSGAQWDQLKALDVSAYCFADRAAFTDQGARNLEDLAAYAMDAPFLVHANVLHTPHPAAAPSPWRTVRERQELLAGHAATNRDGSLAIRWVYSWSRDPRDWNYHVNAATTSAADYADLLLSWVAEYPVVDGFLLDYLDQRPNTWQGQPAVTLDRVGGWRWREYQAELVRILRLALGAEAPLVANGRWGLEEPAFTEGFGLSGILWERCGTLWWDPREAAAIAGARGATTWQWFDPRRGPKLAAWSGLQLAETLAAATDGAVIAWPETVLV